MFETVKQDIHKYMVTEDVENIGQAVNVFLFNDSLQLILSYRFGRWVRNECRIPVVRAVLKIITIITHELACRLTGISIHFENRIGPGFYIGHTGLLVINSKAVIGANCNIGVGVVIGQAGRGEKKGSPVIGDNVFIGVGAKVLGKVKVGNNAVIGANAVVVKDVPDNAVVGGVPAKILSYAGSKDFIRS